ncbi:3-oxoacyl-ACP reductase [Streptomyces sp. CB00316]|uniref:3-oxoacyl-ACP reductase FabG n=1 Tax=unclassified Streptomyces TaxID=2593676 RepID=UPI000938D968|nr:MULTISPECIES: 3-oxoacyl-ACP reductase FabG [unclassified Streptomyces]MBT2376498.1 3-oxoacyl-ACP reductase FabG [Streptomyces sp. ISL-111]MBT2424613.1 3-oxoacyl-ACP reductase FabG [Streptomyces sp. ISL-112]MBT2465148.1 3-oxoacyl-ACP reductase FabG [Streptomyces sp. ISL-63]OKJ21056.1 3-oxoacyl-ACP reductase [Streptomyces sp. CB00316]
MARSVLVTGGNRGIGRAIALSFAEAGDRVAVTHRAGTPPRGVLGVRCDVRDSDQVDLAFKQVEEENGPVEVLVANAGVTRDRLLAVMRDEDFSSVFDTNVGGAFRVSRRALYPMMRARCGRIVLISSVAGMLGSAGQTNYAASKAAIIGFARSLAREVASRNITVNVIAPGIIDTDMTAALPERRQKEMRGAVPLGRSGTADEVARVVRFIAGPDAGYVTGAVIPVDGGLGMGH